MRISRQLAASALAAGIAATSLVVGGAGAANATDTPAATSAVGSDATLAPGQRISCKVQIQNPHNSSHVRGTVNVVTTVKCSARVADIKLTVELFHQGRQVASRGFNRAGVASLQGNAAHACASGEYQGKAQVTVTFPPGYKPPVATGSVVSRSVNIHC